jgi:hypothetical protein
MRRSIARLYTLASAVSLTAVAACASGSATGDDVDAATVDARAIDAVAVAIDAAEVDATVVDATVIDATVVDAAVIDAAVIDATVIDATVVDATVIDATVIDAGAIDGGITVPDTCAQAQNLTAAAAMGTGTTVTGNTTGAADDVSSPTGTCTGYTPDGPDHVYVVTLNAGQRVTATATPTSSWDISLELVTPCSASPTCLAGSDSSISGAETATYLATATTTVYVVVDGYNPGVAGPYSLLVRIQ